MTAENVLKQCVEVLERIMSDDAVPRNIRRSAESVKTILMALHTRTLIWNVASQLETIPVS